MTWLNADFTVDDALARSHAAWDLLIDNWGNESAPSADGTSLRFPALTTRSLPAPAAIAIGPRSLVDRAIIQWDIQKVLPNVANWDFYRRVSVESPLTFWQPANRNNSGTGANAGSLVILTDGLSSQPPSNNGNSDSLRFGTQYYKADGTLATFASDNVNSPKFVSPLLHLVFYFQPPGLLPTKRHPAFYRNNIRSSAGAGVEQLCLQYPIFGRKNVKVSMHSTTDAGVSYRVAIIDELTDAVSFLPVEKTVFSAAGVPINVPATADLDLDGTASYLMIYMTGPDNDVRANFKVKAVD